MPYRPGDPIFSVNHIRHRYAAREILADVTLTIHHGDRLGLLGVNGAGKTTLLKVMAGALRPDGGEVVAARGLRIAYLPQEFQLEPGHTVRESVLAGVADLVARLADYAAIGVQLETAGDDEFEPLLEAQAALAEELDHSGAWDLERTVETVMARLRVPADDRLVETLSGGEARRVSLARTLVARQDLLILDEPTNHLDADSIAWLEGYLASYRGSVLLVTHDRYFLDRVVNRMVELEAGKVTTYAGNYTDYLEAKAAKQEADAHSEQVRRNVLKRELDWVRKQPRARQAKSKAREEAYYELAAQEGPPLAEEIALKIPTGDVRLGRKILELANVSKAFHGKQLFDDLTLALVAGDRIGVVGANGLGKTTLMRMIQGLEPVDAGSLEVGPNTRYVYADQGRSRVALDKTLYQDVGAGGDHLIFEDRTLTVRSYLSRFLFSSEQQNTLIAKFSGGEQNRAQLAKLLAKGGNVLILDEPTNDLDLPTLRALEEALLAFPGCAFVVSHDRFISDPYAGASCVSVGPDTFADDGAYTFANSYWCGTDPGAVGYLRYMNGIIRYDDAQDASTNRVALGGMVTLEQLRPQVLNLGTGTALAHYQSGCIITNENYNGNVTYTLPPIQPGLVYTFEKRENNAAPTVTPTMTITADGADMIYDPRGAVGGSASISNSLPYDYGASVTVAGSYWFDAAGGADVLVWRVTNATGGWAADRPGRLAPGSQSFGDGEWHIQYKRLQLTGTQRLTLAGTARYIITDL